MCNQKSGRFAKKVVVFSESSLMIESICASLKAGDFESDGEETELDLLLTLGGGLVEVEDLAMSAAFLVHCGVMWSAPLQ
jgi:hypothetical protein